MGKVVAATIAAKRHLSLARVLANSFREHHPEIPFFVLLADEVDGRFDPSKEPFQILHLGELAIPDPARFRFHYRQQELTYAATPYLLAYLLQRGFTSACFFKQESLVLGDLSPILERLAGHSILLTPHLLAPLAGDDRHQRELNILQSGVYNVGFLGVTETETTRAFLGWWQDRLYYYCRHDVSQGMHYEQRWLDLVPAFFEDVHILRHPGFNVGHWNLPERSIREAGNQLMVEDEVCRFFRFSGFDPDQPLAVTRYSSRLPMASIGAAATLFARYRGLLEEAGYHETKTWPYAYDYFDNGITIPDLARELYRDFGKRSNASAILSKRPALIVIFIGFRTRATCGARSTPGGRTCKKHFPTLMVSIARVSRPGCGIPAPSSTGFSRIFLGSDRMKTLAVGTIVAKNYLPFARVLAESFRRHHPDIPFFVVLADEADGFFDPAAESFSILTLPDLAIPRLERFCFQNSRQQLITAAKPYLLSYLLDQGFASAVFFDADILVLGNLDPLFAVVQRHAIVMTPHLLAPLKGPAREARELNILLSGTYNGGFLGVSDTPSSRSFLAWWQDRLYEHCRHAVERGMHYDQHWLDLVPVYFDGVHILRDPTYNVAYWSLPERNAHVPENLSPADNQACRFFHFSGFDPEQPPAVTRYSPRLTMGNVGPAVSLFDHYATQLSAAGYHVAKNWPYAYGCFDNGVAIPRIARQLYLALGQAAERFGNPRRAGGTGSYFHWLNEPTDSCPDPALMLTQLWRAIYEQRPDLQVAFPDAPGASRRDFVGWAANFGVKEMGVPGSFVPSGWEA